MDRHITHAVFHTFAFLAFSCLAFSTLAFWCRIFMSRNFMSRIFSVPVKFCITKAYGPRPSLYLALRAWPWLCALSVGLSGQCLCTHRLAVAEDNLSYLRTRVCRDTACDLTFVPPPTPTPSPITTIADIYPLVCVRVGTAGRPLAIVIFWGRVRGGGQMPSTRYV